jgi:hypothetical protein
MGNVPLPHLLPLMSSAFTLNIIAPPKLADTIQSA